MDDDVAAMGRITSVARINDGDRAVWRILCCTAPLRFATRAPPRLCAIAQRATRRTKIIGMALYSERSAIWQWRKNRRKASSSAAIGGLSLMADKRKRHSRLRCRFAPCMRCADAHCAVSPLAHCKSLSVCGAATLRRRGTRFFAHRCIRALTATLCDSGSAGDIKHAPAIPAASKTLRLRAIVRVAPSRVATNPHNA
jgi:hypothetical protein